MLSLSVNNLSRLKKESFALGLAVGVVVAEERDGEAGVTGVSGFVVGGQISTFGVDNSRRIKSYN